MSKPKNRKIGRIVSSVLILIGILLVAFGTYEFGTKQAEYNYQESVNAQLADNIKESKPTKKHKSGFDVDWDALKAQNPDIVGWIKVVGTPIDYPVYQGDTNETYLHTTAYGTYSIGGQIFMDYANRADNGLEDYQTILYGHHLRNGSMFAAVDDMASQSTFDSISTVWYLTPEADYELEPLLFYKAAKSDNSVRRFDFNDTEAFNDYLSSLLDKSTTRASDASSKIGNLSKVLTLVTCDYNNNFGLHQGRGLLVCNLKSEG